MRSLARQPECGDGRRYSRHRHACTRRGDPVWSCRAACNRASAGRQARPQRQDRLGPIERLNLTLLVHAQDQRLRRGIHVQADHVPQLADEVRVAAELEGLRAMRLQVAACQIRCTVAGRTRCAEPSTARSSAWRRAGSCAASHSRWLRPSPAIRLRRPERGAYFNRPATPASNTARRRRNKVAADPARARLLSSSCRVDAGAGPHPAAARGIARRRATRCSTTYRLYRDTHDWIAHHPGRPGRTSGSSAERIGVEHGSWFLTEPRLRATHRHAGRRDGSSTARGWSSRGG